MRVNKIGIVGGGPGGLMTAYFLEKMADRPVEMTIFEATDRVGGKIVSPRFQAVPVQYEAGAAEFYDYSHFDDDPLKELIDELGLSISPMGGSAAIMDGQVLSNLDDIRGHFGKGACQELQAFDHRARDIMIPQEFYHSDHPEGSTHPDLSLEERTLATLIANVTDTGARRYLETLMHSDLATEPNRTNVAYGLQNYLMNDPDYMRLYGIVGGNEQFPNELAARIGANIRLRHRVEGLGNANDSGQLRIQSLFDGERTQTDFDIVVVSLPLAQLLSVKFEEGELSAVISRHYENYNYPAHYLRITILFEEPFWQPTMTDSFWMLDQFGGCCLYDESSRQPGGRHGVLGWLLGGEVALEMCQWTDEKLIEAALESLPEFMAAGRRHFLEGAVNRWPASVNAMPGGKQLFNLDRRHQPAPTSHPNLFLVGDYLYDTTLNGVLDSAHYVASWIAAKVLLQANVKEFEN